MNRPTVGPTLPCRGGLVLELRHPAGLAEAGQAPQHPAQLRVLGIDLGLPDYRDLLNRIHKYEAQPDDDHGEEARPEIVETSVLDELSEIKESELRDGDAKRRSGLWAL